MTRLCFGTDEYSQALICRKCPDYIECGKVKKKKVRKEKSNKSKSKKKKAAKKKKK